MGNEAKKNDRASILARMAAMSDEELTALEGAKPAETTTVGAPAVATAPAPAAVVETVAISASELASIKAAADAYHRQQAERKTALVTQITTSQGKDGAFSADDLNAMSTDHLLKLAKSLKLEDSIASSDYATDYSLRDRPSSRMAVSTQDDNYELPDTWGLSAAAKAKAAN